MMNCCDSFHSTPLLDLLYFQQSCNNSYIIAIIQLEYGNQKSQVIRLSSKDRIRDVAFHFFSQYGYEGTALSQIAKEVNIKTPSLYAHYESKEDIFFSCLHYALDSDLLFFKNELELTENTNVENTLYNFLINYETRLKSDVVSIFCLRTLYSPPHEFKSELFLQTNERIAELGKLLLPLFEHTKNQGNLKNMEIEEAIEAYLCLFDGLIIEFMYAGSERFQYRLTASWKLFKYGVFQ